MEILKVKDSQGKEYQSINGTCYHVETPARVIEILEHSRQFKNRLRIHFGEPKTGKAWGDIEIGHVGRSTGTFKIPLMIHNARSMGGGALLDHCVVKIEHANKRDGGIIYDITK